MPVTASGYGNKDAVFIADTGRGLRWEEACESVTKYHASMYLTDLLFSSNL